MSAEDFGLTVGGTFVKLVWDAKSRNLGRKLRTGPRDLHNAAVIVSHRMAPEVENYMKTNAPWRDRTGNARNGLAARAYEEADSVGIVLYHQVSYGIWLEVRWGGKYAIINPTIDVMGPRVMAAYNDLLGRL
jgi:hypothetical protein